MAQQTQGLQFVGEGKGAETITLNGVKIGFRIWVPIKCMPTHILANGQVERVDLATAIELNAGVHDTYRM